jgi:hypothetical protein
MATTLKITTSPTDIGRTTAKVRYNTDSSDWSLPDNVTSDGSSPNYTYSALKKTWSFTYKKSSDTTYSTGVDSSGNTLTSSIYYGDVTYGKLSAATTYNLKAEVTVTCTKTTTYKVEIKDSEGKGTGKYTTGSSSTSTYSLGSAYATLTIYTRPEEFSWSNTISSGETININYTDWNNLVKTTAKYLDWKNQSSGHSGGTSTTQNSLISASIYNSVANKLDVATVTAMGYKTDGTYEAGSLIKASNFKALSDKINS